MEKSLEDFIKQLTRPDIEKSFNDIKEYIKCCEEDRKRAIDRVKEWNKDEEIVRLKKEIEELRKAESENLVFEISKEEQNAINTWKEKHLKEKHNNNSYAGAIGGRYTYEFCPTSIGVIGTIKCSCGEEFCFCEL